MLGPRPKPSRRDRRTYRGPLEWVGAKVTVPVYVTEGEPYRPEAIVWLELPSDLIVQWTLIDPARPAPSFADTLRDAMRSPHAGPPRRPARIRVADRTLAGEVRAALAGLAGLAEATEIVIAPTPEIAELVRRFAESAPEGDEQESYLEGGRVPPAAVAALFRAASVLHHSAPWKIANDGQVLWLDVPELGIAGGAISIIGGLGVSLGFLVFPSLEAYDAFARAGERHAKDVRRRRAPERLDLGSRVLTLTLDPAADLTASMRKEVLKHGWSVAGLEAYPRVLHVERDGVVRPHGEDEVRLVTACALALAAFVTKHEALFSGRRLEPVSESYTADTTGLTVRLTAPYEAFEALEGDPEHPDDPRPAALGGRRLGRNEPCPCGSGKKYKRCHLDADEAAAGGTRASSSGGDAPSETSDLHALDRRLAHDLAVYARERFGAEWLRFERDFSDAQAAVQLAGHWALYHLRVRGRRVVEHFQAERGERLTAEERDWLGAQSRAWLGVWEVEDAEPGVSLDLHDLLTGERRHVIEASGSRTIVRRSAALARIVDHRGLSLICGTHAQPLPPLEAAEVARAFRDRLRRGPASPIERLREERTGRDLIARWDGACAALEERSRVPPRLQNTDGDELVFVTQRFDFDPAARDEIERRLRAMDDVVPPDDGDAERDYVFHREGGGGRPGWEDLIVGHAEVGERALGVETNSLRRAQALRRRIEAALGDLVRYRRSRRRDAQRMAERAWERGPSTHDTSARGDVGARDLEADPAVQQALREMKERHYAGWPDEPLPALGGKTARQAVRSGAGRERVDALLKDIEHREAGLPAAERFDVAVLRHALGI